MNQKNNKTQGATIERWNVAAMGMAHTYADAMAKINGWKRENGTPWAKYVYRLENSLSKAVVSGELRAREGITGLYLEPGLDAYNDGVIDLQDFCNWARKAGLDGVPDDALKVAAALGLPHTANLTAPQQTHITTQAAPAQQIDTAPAPGMVPASEPRATATGPQFTMTKAAMIEQHKHEWLTIEQDFKGAARNGLSAAKAGAREWREADAMQWARAKGRLTSIDKPAQSLTGAMNNMASLPTSQQHTLKG
jgi:hypothetical protein